MLCYMLKTSLTSPLIGNFSGRDAILVDLDIAGFSIKEFHPRI